MSPEKKRMAMLIGFAAVLCVLAGLVYRPPASVPKLGMYFYDIDKGELYVAPEGSVSPMTAPSGGQGLAASVFSCGDCTDEASRFLGYLSVQSDEYTRAVQSGEPIPPEVIQQATRIRSIDGQDYYPFNSPTGRAMIDAVTRHCEGKPPAQLCVP